MPALYYPTIDFEESNEVHNSQPNLDKYEDMELNITLTSTSNTDSDENQIEENQDQQVRRSKRIKKQPTRFNDFIMYTKFSQEEK